jgi:hypothetical protein
MSNSNYTRVLNSTAQLPELTVGELNVPGNADVSGSLNVNGGITGSALIGTGTLNTAGGAAVISAAQLLGGYSYAGAAGGAVALTLPDAASVQAALAAVGVTSAAGTRLVNPISIDVSDANDLTVTAGAGVTVLGTAAVNNTSAVVHITFTGAAAYNAVVFVGAIPDVTSINASIKHNSEYADKTHAIPTGRYGGKLRITALGCYQAKTPQMLNDLNPGWTYTGTGYPNNEDWNTEATHEEIFKGLASTKSDIIIFNGDTVYSDGLGLRDPGSSDPSTNTFTSDMYVGNMDYWDLDTSNAAAGPFFGSYTGQEIADLHVESCQRDLSALEQRMQIGGLSLSDPNVHVVTDDHCMGSRSRNWGAYDSNHKNRFVDIFRNMFDLTTKGLPADRAGAYYSVSKSVQLDPLVSKTVKMIFLDNLYALDDRVPITYSQEQLTWFESELSSAASNKDEFILIGNGSPLLNAVGDVLVGEKNLIITLIAKYKLENVCFMCGDLHYSNVSYFDKGWVPMMEFMSSGLIHNSNGEGSYQSYDIDFFADTVSVVHHQLDNSVPSLTSSVFTQIPLARLRAKNYTNSMVVNGININYLVSKEEMDPILPFLMNGTIHINSLGYHPSDISNVQYYLNERMRYLLNCIRIIISINYC